MTHSVHMYVHHVHVCTCFSLFNITQLKVIHKQLVFHNLEKKIKPYRVTWGCDILFLVKFIIFKNAKYIIKITNNWIFTKKTPRKSYMAKEIKRLKKKKCAQDLADILYFYIWGTSIFNRKSMNLNEKQMIFNLISIKNYNMFPKSQCVGRYVVIFFYLHCYANSFFCLWSMIHFYIVYYTINYTMYSCINEHDKW
jgi:hypothetical protein